MMSKKCFNLSIQLCKDQRKCLHFRHCATTSTTSVTDQSSLQNLPSKSQPKIIIPKRIERSSVDILEALSRTVGRDPTGFHYMYHDDPYLTPTTYLERKKFALSRESGMLAAQWVKQKHPQLFTHTPDDPVIQKFLPNVQYTEESEVSDGTLTDLIDNDRVTDAITVYEICMSKNIEISKESKQSLLELVCFHNCTDDDPFKVNLLKKFYKKSSFINEPMETWKTGNFAEALFESLEQPDAEAYCSIICGLGKHNSFNRAWSMYHEAIKKNLTLDTRTYNSLIRICLLVSGSGSTWEDIKNLLQEMSDKGVTPDVSTLNSSLEAISTLPSNVTNLLSIQILKEFTRLGIKPSLTTYSWLIKHLCYMRKGTKKVLTDIMNSIPCEEITIQDPTDSFFFPMMIAAANSNMDWSIVEDLDKLLDYGDNRKLMSTNENHDNTYTNHKLRLACRLKSPEVFMDLFRMYVPSVHSPGTRLFQDIIQNLTSKAAHEYIPEVLSYNKSVNEGIIRPLIIAIKTFQPSNYNTDVTTQFSALIQQLWSVMKNDYDKSKGQKTLDPEVATGMLDASLKCCKLAVTGEMVKFVRSNPNIVLGAIDSMVLWSILENAVEQDSVSIAMNVANLWSEYGYGDLNKTCKIAATVKSMTPLDHAKLQFLQEQKSIIETYD